MTLQLCNLPVDLLLRILSLLDPDDLVASQLSSRILHNIVLASPLLQYQCALQVAGLIDNPHSQLPVVARHALLKKRELAWSELHSDFTASIPVRHIASGIYELSGGVYFLGDLFRPVIHWYRLPSSEEEREEEWKAVDVGVSILDFGVNVYEWDLMAVFTTRPGTTINPTGPYVTYDIELRLFELSTGIPHPLASQPIILVMNSPFERPTLGIEIVGRNLVFVLASHRNMNMTQDDRVYVYDWMEGRVKMQFTRPAYTYSDILMLHEDLFILPNAIDGTLEYWVISATSQSNPNPNPAYRLSLPRLHPTYRYRHIACRAYPNPTSSSSSFPHKHSKLFHADPQKTIAIINLLLTPSDIFPLQMDVIRPLMENTFFVQRGELVKLLEDFISSSATSSSPEYSSPPVPYSEWGPPITRWMKIISDWITTTAGQRVVISNGGGQPGDEWLHVEVLDFNPYEIRRGINRENRRRTDNIGTRMPAAMLHNLERDYQGEENELLADDNDYEVDGREWDGLQVVDDDDDTDDDEYFDSLHRDGEPEPIPSRNDGTHSLIHTATGTIDAAHQHFAEPILYSLPFVEYRMMNLKDWHSVMIDEERVLGINRYAMGRMNIIVEHYG